MSARAPDNMPCCRCRAPGLPVGDGVWPNDRRVFRSQPQQRRRCALSQPGDPLTVADLQGLTCLAAGDRQITNLSGLDWATNLAGLYLSRNAIADLGPLQNLIGLRSLELEQNQISDLSPLLGLRNLTCLSPGGNPVNDYSVLSNLSCLSSLSVRGGLLTDLTILQSLKQLETSVNPGSRPR